MYFSALLDLPYDLRTGLIDPQALVAALPETPQPVATQLLRDHGRKDDFQSLYGHLDLERVEWRLSALLASTLCEAGFNPEYEPWLRNVDRRADHFATQSWACIDPRSIVVEHWSQYRTWRTPPVVFSGLLLDSTFPIHLAEGHTRLGLLRGLVRVGALAPGSVHEVWLGRGRDA